MVSKFGILSVAAMAVDLKLSVSPASRSTSSDGSYWLLTLLLLPLQRRPNLERALFDVVDVETLEVTIVASRQGLKLQPSSSFSSSEKDKLDSVHVTIVIVVVILTPT